MAFYLKYRPQTIALLDLAAVRKELQTILGSGNFSHAYLFSGPRGTGKTSAARILAKVVNCEKNQKALDEKTKKPLSEPCDKCISCREIAAGTAIDLVEIDAASNRGIDDIRDLREKIKLAPLRSRYRVYIIDEVHMLTSEAFNALLKTLEEPPGHALFILCTTEPEKIPETIVSRCTRVRFNRATPPEIVESLKKAVLGEGFQVEEGVLEEVAGLAEGSFRDAMKVLEQLSQRLATREKSKRRIELADVAEVVGMSSGTSVGDFLAALVAFDKEKAFSLLSDFQNEGVAQKQLVVAILERLRRLLLREIGVEEGEPILGLDLAGIRRLIDIFSQAAMSLKTAAVAELPLELATVEWFGEGRLAGKTDSGGGKSPTTEIKALTEEVKPVKIITKKTKTAAKSAEPEEKDGGERQEESGVVDISFAKVRESWPQVLERLRPENHSLEALLKVARPVRIGNNGLVVEVAYKFHKEQLELARYKALVETAVREVVSPGLKLSYVLTEQLSQKTTNGFKEHDNLSGKVEDEEIVKAAEEIFAGEN